MTVSISFCPTSNVAFENTPVMSAKSACCYHQSRYTRYVKVPIRNGHLPRDLSREKGESSPSALHEDNPYALPMRALFLRVDDRGCECQINFESSWKFESNFMRAMLVHSCLPVR
jgi:hypothetical protein